MPKRFRFGPFNNRNDAMSDKCRSKSVAVTITREMWTVQYHEDYSHDFTPVDRVITHETRQKLAAGLNSSFYRSMHYLHNTDYEINA